MLYFLLSIAEESERDKIEFIYTQFREDMLKYAKARFRHSGYENCELNAEDAVQNAFYKLTLYIKALDFTRGKQCIKSYCLTVVSNEVTNIMKDRTNTNKTENISETLADEDSIENIFSDVEVSDLYVSVTKQIKKLDPKYSTALMYRYYNNMSIKEIADLMGISEQTVYTRLHRGLDKLRGLLEEDKTHGNI